MKNDIQEPTQEEIDRMHARLAKDAKQGGYTSIRISISSKALSMD